MGCETIPTDNGIIIMCGHGRPAKLRCNCGHVATLVCDYPSTDHPQNLLSCDKPLCANCAVRMADEIQFCSDHPIATRFGAIYVGNVKNGDTGHYIGRGMRASQNYPGFSPSALGNPFRPSKQLPGQLCLDLYKKWLWRAMKNNDALVLDELRRLTARVLAGQDIVLLCWCKRPDGTGYCHGDVIKQAIGWLSTKLKLVK